MDLSSVIGRAPDGLVEVATYHKANRQPEEVAILEKAAHYGADAVFFEAPRNGGPSIAQAFIYRSGGPADDPSFARLHQRLWSWGGVPLVYRATEGLVQLFRCAHRPDFEVNGEIQVEPFQILKTAAQIADDPWWDFERLRNGTFWDDPNVCRDLLSSEKAAQKALISAVAELYNDLNTRGILPRGLRRKLLILSVLIKYLEARNAFEDGYFSRFLSGAKEFFEVLKDGRALVSLLEDLEERFNGNVFTLDDEDRETLRDSNRLEHFARFIKAKQEASGQLTLWERYSFADLPVELISHIYQLFVADSATAVYTPPFLVRLMLDEVMSSERLDRLEKRDEIILDPACGSGIFLVEAYKRLVLHWRSCNDWKRPSQTVLKRLLNRVHGVDWEEGAVELAAFSLCLALCDALEPEEIRASVKLFPPLKEKTIHTGCFFDAREKNKIKKRVGMIVGNPPFASSLRPGSEQRAYTRYQEKHGPLPDKQIAYLFLHESMEMLAPGGVLSMLQQYNFLYNQKSFPFRQRFVERWNIREILDFISIRGLFRKAKANTTVVVVVAEASPPPRDKPILHATFRRSGRADAQQGFDIDYYDMHWLPHALVLKNDGIWRADSMGGGRVLAFVGRMKELQTLGKHAEEREWDYGEGWIEGEKGKRILAKHITGRPWIPSKYLTEEGLDEKKIRPCSKKLFKTSYTEKRFTPPMLLVRSHLDFHHAIWTKAYLTYTQRIIGFCAPLRDLSELRAVSKWLQEHKVSLKAFLAATSPRVFTQKSTALTKDDIVSLPFDDSGRFRLSPHEHIIAADIVDYYCDLVRLGQKSRAMREPGVPALPDFNDIFTRRIHAVYRKAKLRALKHYVWPGVICQPYVFGKGNIDWSDSGQLKDKVAALLREKRGTNLNVTRIARLYDGPCIYLIKPDRLRYWLGSIALRDADETLADLWDQGY